MPGVLILIFQIIGIVFACVGGFIVFALVTPLVYSVDASYHGEPCADVKGHWLLGLLRFFVTFSEGKPTVLVKLLFFTVYDSSKAGKKKKKKKKRKRKNEKKKKNIKKEKKPVADQSVNEKDNDLFELDDDENKETPKTAKEKFIFVVEKIIGFFKAAGDKIELAAVWLDEDHRNLYGFLWNNGLKIFKKVRPKRFEADISMGTGNPATTGMIISVVSIILGFTGIDTVRINPDFDEKRIDADIFASGRFFVLPVILTALKIYRNKYFRKFILKK